MGHSTTMSTLKPEDAISLDEIDVAAVQEKKGGTLVDYDDMSRMGKKQ